MRTAHFDECVRAALAQEPVGRREGLAELHDLVYVNYMSSLARLSGAQAARQGVDGRSIAQVVGHIAEWERWAILAVSEVLAGVELPRLMSLRGYPADDAPSRSFSTEDGFNAYQAARMSSWPWERVRAVAIAQATALYGLWARPGVLPLHRIERTRPASWRLGDGSQLTVSAGWCLWLVTLEHAGVDHAVDLYPEEQEQGAP